MTYIVKLKISYIYIYREIIGHIQRNYKKYYKNNIYRVLFLSIEM